MKRMIRSFAGVCMVAVTMTACQKNTREAAPEEVSQSALAQIQRLGFSTEDVRKIPEGYLVEGDIILSQADLSASPSSPSIIIAQEEQYRTFNLVSTTKHPQIKVALSNSSSDHEAAFSAALNEAISRYNAQNLAISFARVSASQSPDITVVAYYERSNVLGSAGFPNSSSDPYHTVRMNTYHYSNSTGTTNVNYIGTIMAHEIGHCIGFRHTDYMDRSFSCGGRKQNEEKPFPSGYGAVHIPGTPTTADKASWMLACIPTNLNRPFNANDVTALNQVY